MPSLAQINTIITQTAPGWNETVAHVDSKVLQDIVYTPLAQDALERPVLIFIITAGKLVPLMNSLKQAVVDCGEQLKAKGFAPKGKSSQRDWWSQAVDKLHRSGSFPSQPNRR